MNGVGAAGRGNAVRTKVVSYRSEYPSPKNPPNISFPLKYESKGTCCVVSRCDQKFPGRTRNIGESNERSLTLDIHAFGLDKTIYHKIPLSTYLFTEQNFNTPTLSGFAQAHVRWEAFSIIFFFTMKKHRHLSRART